MGNLSPKRWGCRHAQQCLAFMRSEIRTQLLILAQQALLTGPSISLPLYFFKLPPPPPRDRVWSLSWHLLWLLYFLQGVYVCMHDVPGAYELLCGACPLYFTH